MMGSSTSAMTVSLILHFFKGSSNFIRAPFLYRQHVIVSVIVRRHCKSAFLFLVMRCCLLPTQTRTSSGANSISGQHVGDRRKWARDERGKLKIRRGRRKGNTMYQLSGVDASVLIMNIKVAVDPQTTLAML